MKKKYCLKIYELLLYVKKKKKIDNIFARISQYEIGCSIVFSPNYDVKNVRVSHFFSSSNLRTYWNNSKTTIAAETVVRNLIT